MIVISPGHKLLNNPSKHCSLFYMERWWIRPTIKNADSYRLYLDLLAELSLQGSREETAAKLASGRMRTYCEDKACLIMRKSHYE